MSPLLAFASYVIAMENLRDGPDEVRAKIMSLKGLSSCLCVLSHVIVLKDGS